MNASPILIHPARRAIERGIRSVDPTMMVRAIEWEISHRPDTSELVERVMRDRKEDGREVTFWRFRVAEGLFYAVVSDRGTVITILTQEMMRAYKAKRRGRVGGWREYNLKRALGVRI